MSRTDRRAAPRAFGGLDKAVRKGGTPDCKTKEIFARHVEALIKAGASRENVCDGPAMGIPVGGGPVMMHAAQALASFAELSAA